MGSKPDKTRSDLKTKPKSKQRSEDYNKYKRYLKSKEFKEVKKIVYERDGGKCVVCGRGKEDGVDLTVHHKTYRNLYKGGQIEANDCVLLCRIDHTCTHSAKKNWNWYSKNNPRNKPDNNGDNTLQEI